jgi:low affinity Fe/Cu permease
MTFDQAATATAREAGKPWAFIASLAVVVLWAVLGPVFKYSDTWQLVINTGTTVVTFWMVFLIQNTQNRDMLALQLKLDELIRAVQGASNKMAGIEDESEAKLEAIRRNQRR